MTTSISGPKKLAIYYAHPSMVNNSNGNINQAVATFSLYDIVVFGAGLESPSHSDHNKTVSIINNSGMINTQCFGYIKATVDITDFKEKLIYGKP